MLKKLYRWSRGLVKPHSELGRVRSAVRFLQFGYIQVSLGLTSAAYALSALAVDDSEDFMVMYLALARVMADSAARCGLSKDGAKQYETLCEVVDDTELAWMENT